MLQCCSEPDIVFDSVLSMECCSNCGVVRCEDIAVRSLDSAGVTANQSVVYFTKNNEMETYISSLAHCLSLPEMIVFATKVRFNLVKTELKTRLFSGKACAAVCLFMIIQEKRVARTLSELLIIAALRPKKFSMIYKDARWIGKTESSHETSEDIQCLQIEKWIPKVFSLLPQCDLMAFKTFCTMLTDIICFSSAHSGRKAVPTTLAISFLAYCATTRKKIEHHVWSQLVTKMDASLSTVNIRVLEICDLLINSAKTEHHFCDLNRRKVYLLMSGVISHVHSHLFDSFENDNSDEKDSVFIPPAFTSNLKKKTDIAGRIQAILDRKSIESLGIPLPEHDFRDYKDDIISGLIDNGHDAEFIQNYRFKIPKHE